MDIRNIQKHYREALPIANRWDDASFIYSWRNPIGYYMREQIRKRLVALLNRHHLDISSGQVLDIGCGTGDWLRFCAELRGVSRGLFGVDLSYESLYRAELINAGISFSLGDARNLPFVDGTFKFISQLVAFEHFLNNEDLNRACAEASRVCAPSGWLLWFDLLPMSSKYQRGFTLGDVLQLFPDFTFIESQGIFRTIPIPYHPISNAYSLARRSYWLADMIDFLRIGRATNLMVLMQKHA